MYLLLPHSTMETASTNPTSNKYIDRYFENTLTVLSTITRFETQIFLHDTTEASIKLLAFNNVFIPFGLSRLVMIDL